MTGVTGTTGRSEGAANCIMTMAVETTTGVMSGISNTGAIVVGLGMTNLAEATVVGCVDKAVNRISVRNGDGGSVSPGAFQ